MGVPHVREVEPQRLAALLVESERLVEAREPATFMREAGYEVLEHLGSGSTGSVWRARQLAARRDVALKLVHAPWLDSASACARFEREVELTARLEHPHIARLYDSGVHRGVYFYAMELVRGVPLDQYVDRRRPTRSEIVRLIGTVCRAVQHAHERGIIHRDLKPSNVLVDDQGRPHVLDFGLAGTLDARVGSRLSLEGQVIGTPEFMSPEQASGDRLQLDTRSDVYSLGVLFYHLLTGSFPHDIEGSPVAILRRLAEQEPVRPRHADPSVDAELEAVLLKALERDPKARYPSAGELADDIDRYLRGDPLIARPPTLGYFVTRRVRQHRLPLAASAVAALLIMGAAVWSYVRVEQARRVAVTQRTLAVMARDESERQRALAEERLTDDMLARADALGTASRWTEAKQTFEDARGALAAQGRPTLPADLGLYNAYRFAPPAVNVLSGHDGAANAAAFAPDGSRAVSGGDDRTVRVWDLLTGRQLLCLRGHAQAVTCVDFSPDGRTVASGSSDGTVRVWDARSGRLIHLLYGVAAVRQIAFVPPGDRLVATTGNIRVLNLRDGTDIALNRAMAFAVAAAPDGLSCLAGEVFGLVERWDTRTNRFTRAVRFRGGPADRVGCVAFSPDGQRFLSCIEERLWVGQVAEGEPAVFAVRPGGFQTATFSPRGNRIIAAGNDGVVYVFDARNGQILSRVWGDDGVLRNVCFSPDRRLALSPQPDGRIKLLRVDDPDQPRVLPHDQRVGAMTVSSAANALIAGTTSAAKMFDVATGAARHLLPLTGKSQWVVAVAATPDARTVLGGTERGEVFLWHPGPDCSPIPLGTHDWDLRAAAVSPDGRLGLTVNGNETKLWDLSPASARRELWAKRADGTYAHAAAFTSDGGRVFGVTVHGHVVGWDLVHDVQVPGTAYLDVPTDLNSNGVFNPDGSALLAACESVVYLWDTHTGRKVRQMPGHRGRVNAVAMSADGRLAASGADDHLVKVWDLHSGRELVTLEGHDARVVSVCLSPTGDRLFTAAEDGRLLAWDLSLPDIYRDFAARLAAVRIALRDQPFKPSALRTLAQWYSFRGLDKWAAPVQESPRCKSVSKHAAREMNR